MTACNDLSDDAPTVDGTEIATNQPAAMGGVIADGTYVLTAVTLYTGGGGPAGSSGVSASVVLTIAGTTMEQVGRFNGQDVRSTATLMASGTTLQRTGTCPTAMTDWLLYTATATELRLYTASEEFALVQTYTRQ
jgi:hypothetical protein